MEYVSVLAGEEWSDAPKCVHPFIANMARGVNDEIESDDERARLLVPLIGRLLTANVKGEVRSDQMHKALTMFTFDWAKRHLSSKVDCLNMHSVYDWPVSGCMATAVVKFGGVPYLIALLDEFDRLTQREVEGVHVSEEDMRDANYRVHGQTPPPKEVPVAVEAISVGFSKIGDMKPLSTIKVEGPSVTQEDMDSAWSKMVKALVGKK